MATSAFVPLPAQQPHCRPRLRPCTWHYACTQRTHPSQQNREGPPPHDPALVARPCRRRDWM